MTGKLSFASIETLYELGGYANNAELSDSSALFALTGLMLMQNPDTWSDYGDGFEIQELIAKAIYEITQGMPMSDYELIETQSAIADVAYLEIDDISYPSGEYRVLKLFVSGMYTDYNSSWADSVLMQINHVTVAQFYNSYARLLRNTTPYDTENLGTVAGVQFPYVAATPQQSSGYFGNLDVTFFAPYIGDYKHCYFDAMVGGDATQQISRVVGSGVAEVATYIDNIKIFPLNGTTFLVDPAEAAQPDQIVMSLYGLR